MGAGLRTLAMLEIPIGRGDRPFARINHIAIAGHAHRTAGIAPLEPRLDEYLVEPGGSILVTNHAIFGNPADFAVLDAFFATLPSPLAKPLLP